MSKFNSKTKGNTVVTNHEGEVAYSVSAEMELYALACTSLLSDKYYESEREQLARLRNLVSKVDPEFVVKLAVYARTQMYMRTLPLVLIVELAKVHSGDSLIGKAIDKVVLRADEITELLAYYELANGRKSTKKLNAVPAQFKKGLARAFNRFDEYQFAKYNRDTGVKFRDALFLFCPKPKDDETQKLFNKIAEDKLEVPYTWETQLSDVGQKSYETPEEKAKAVKQVWTELIESGRLGYMALMRNLRNMLDAGVDGSVMDKVCERIADPEQVRRSHQFPFRFLAAYEQLRGNSSGLTANVLEALEKAMVVSAENVAGFDSDTRVLIASDVSGSMSSPLSPRSKMTQEDVGLVLSMILQHRCRNIVSGVFGTDWKIIQFPRENILANASKLRGYGREVGHGTDGYKVLADIRSRKAEFDKVFIFTDMQMWNSGGYWGNSRSFKDEWQAYLKEVNPNAKLYLFDLAGYGNTPVSTNASNVTMIAGWSDKIFDMLSALENGSSVVKEIKKIEL